MIRLPLAYKEIIEADKPYNLVYGGRLGGKSKGTALLAIMMMMANPYTDGIVARVSYGSMGDSSYSEFQAAIADIGMQDEFRFKKSPMRIERKGDAGTIYFVGYGGSNTSRTKSIKTKHKVGFVILEETQELKQKVNFDEAMASFRRNFGENVKVFVLGNPPPIRSHWFNEMIEEKRRDADWTVRKVTWMDIIPFINDFDLKEILKTKATNPTYYNWLYMGEAEGGFGSVYPMFRREAHVISADEWNWLRERRLVRIRACVIGGDGAVTHDATSFVPILLLDNGQAVIGRIFFHEPLKDGVIGYHQLVQDDLTRWFRDICGMYGLGTAEDRLRSPNAPLLPIYMRIDSAAPDLIQECRFFFGNRADVGPVKKHHVIEMVGVVQSALSNGNAMIIDYGTHLDYRTNRTERRGNVLVEQLEALVWNDRQTGYNPIVPNDCADAFTYGAYSWWSNVENIQFFNLLKKSGAQNRLIKEILKERRD